MSWLELFDVDAELVPDDVKIGKAQVRFLEKMRAMGRECFADNELFGRYCRTLDLLGDDCRMTRLTAIDVLTDETFQRHLRGLQEELEWLILPKKQL